MEREREDLLCVEEAKFAVFRNFYVQHSCLCLNRSPLSVVEVVPGVEEVVRVSFPGDGRGRILRRW